MFATLIRRRPHAFALAAIVLASLLFELYVSSRCSLWLDEVNTYRDVRLPWPQVLAGAELQHPPLVFVLVKLVVACFGLSALSLRVVSLLSGCALLVTVDALCRELGFAPRRALLVVGSVALAPFFTEHAAEARHYMLFPAAGALAFWCVLRAVREPTRVGYLAGFAASASVMGMTHYFGLAYAGALFGVVLVSVVPRYRTSELTRRQTVLAGLALSAFLAIFCWFLRDAVALARFYARPGMAEDTLPWRELLREMIDEFSLTGATPGAAELEIPLAAAGLVLLARPLPGIVRVVPAALAFGPCVLALFISSGHFVAPRYLAPSWVLYHLGAVTALFALGDRLARVAARSRPKLLEPVAWAPLLLAMLTRVGSYPREFGVGEEDYRGLQSYFLEHFKADTALVGFKGLFAERIMDVYDIGSRPIWLERFKPRPGVNRYVVAEFEVRMPDRQATLEGLVRRQFGLSAAEWHAIPTLDLPHTELQVPVVARLLVLEGGKVRLPGRKHGHHHGRRPDAPPEE
ncbi:MAG TPA: glycosyltransferase family 39 protein [Polyangiaceae bacterium]|nr:glycosyltransferase family 39 protein [Polyangiaceae bacterium]